MSDPKPLIAYALIVTAVVFGVATISNDNLQDLKTGQLVGATVSSKIDRSKFFKIEPTPLAVDLDGDGVDELIVPQNLVREGLLAVVFKGPAGFRLQSINSGFEGGITCLGAYKTEDATQPTIMAAVVRYNNVLLKAGGETQIIMTVPQD